MVKDNFVQVIGHIDMDCFFCACEEKHNPSLKGKPVVVGGPSDRSVASTANYEARKHGIFAATPIAHAKRLCPNAIFLPVNMKMYYEESYAVMAIFDSFTNNMLPMSCDEAYLDLTKLSQSFDTLEDMANHIKDTVYNKTKLTCSIGISQSTIVSKIASDVNKPNGITIVRDAKDFLKDMPIGKIPGIGRVSKEVYISRGINKIGDLTSLSQPKVYEWFGNLGLKYYRVANGLDFSKIEQRGKIKSVSRETTLEKNTYDIFLLENEIKWLSKQVYKDLKGQFFKTVSIKIKYSDFIVQTKDITLKTYVHSEKEIKKYALELFREIITSQQSVRLIGVKVSNLGDEKNKQQTLV